MKSSIYGIWRNGERATYFNQGLGDTPSTPKDVGAIGSPKSSGSTGREIFLICLGLAAFVVLSVVIFKLWQKKKREEQHARLLRLFEEDDELELELGLRD